MSGTELALDNATFTNGICDFLVRKPPVGALLMFGEWGAGKTTFYKFWLKQELQRRNKNPVYVSVAGLSTTEDLDDALLVAVFPFIASSPAQFVTIGAKAFLRHWKIESKDIRPKADISASTVICIDDLERFDGKVEILFGFVQQLIEARSVPCLLIGDEARLEAKGTAYASIREKLVARHVNFKPSLGKIFDEIVNGIADSHDRDLLFAQRDDVLDVFRQDRTGNLRTLHLVLNTCLPILRLAHEVELPEDRVKTIVAMTAAATLETRRNYEHSGKIFAFISNQHDWLEVAYISDQEDHPVGRFVRKYANLRPQYWASIPAIGDYLLSGVLDGELLRGQLLKLNIAEQSTAYSRLTGGDITKFSDEQFLADQRAYFEELAAAPNGDLAKMVRGASALLYYAAKNATELSGREILIAHQRAIDRHHDSMTLDVGNFDSVMHQDSVAHIAAAGEEGLELAGTISAVAPVAQTRKEANDRARVLQLLQNFDQFEATVFDTNNGWRFKPLFFDTDIEPVAAQLAELSHGEVGRFTEFIRWRAAVTSPQLVVECEFVRALAAAIRLLPRPQSALKRFALDSLASNLEAFANRPWPGPAQRSERDNEPDDEA